MALNPYFNNLEYAAQQDLLEDLIIESIKMYGIDFYYMPRRAVAYDDILHEDDSILYDTAYQIEMYVKDIDNFGGQGNFLSKFGLQINDTTTLTVANRRFEEEVSRYDDLTRPREGDLIFFPLDNTIFRIMYVEDKSIFYQLGKLYVYDLKIEKFDYSNEKIETGIADIDEAVIPYKKDNTNTIDDLDDVFGDWSDNKALEENASDILDFSENNPFGGDIY